MKITKTQTIADVQDAFSAKFPKLKVEFYKAKHEAMEGSKEDERITGNLDLIDLNPNLKEGEIALQDDMSVKALETAFEEQFGLHIQVFRKSGDKWMQTSVTDNWSLGKQEEKGEDLDNYLSSVR